jgi:hypothetical protein
VHAALTKPLGDVGVTVLVRVAKRQHSAGLATLVEEADEHIPILAHRDVAHRSCALGEDDRAEARRQLDRLIAAAARRGRGLLVPAAGEGRDCEHQPG